MPSLALFSKTSKKAFSTGEVILSMFVLSVGLITVMALISNSLKYSLVSRDVIIAAELAQEGVELTRNVRDNHFASGGDGFGSFNNSNRYCRVDFDDSADSLDCEPASNSPARDPSRYYLQYQNGLFAHYSGGTQERFSRALYVEYNTPGAGSDNAVVRSFVYWGGAEAPPDSGEPDNCTTANSCVFTELYLTSWK